MKKVFLLLSCTLCSTLLWAIEPNFTIHLYESTPAVHNGYIDQDEFFIDGPRFFQIATPRLDIYLPKHVNNAVPVLLSIPGGGYKYVSGGNEGINVAEFFCPKGIAVAVLKYRLPNGHENIPLTDACRAMELLRDSAQAWNLQSDHIGVIGFSAGGHLAASLCTKYMSDKARPDYGVLVYPVISSDPTIWHQGSFDELLGAKAKKKQYQAWSIDKRVTAQTPPCFLVACEDDNTVPVENSIRMYQALLKNNVEAQMVLVPEGGHGWGFERQFPKRDIVDGAITQFIFAQLGDKKKAELSHLYHDQFVREERHSDWAKYYRYQQQNDSIIANHIPVKAVFLGNSITDNWGRWRPEFFEKYNCAARGISGQTSYQMLVRMQADVIDLHPEKVFLLIGTNDIACNNGPISDEHFMANMRSICELATLHHIQPIICSILPHHIFYWNPEVTGVTERVDRVNALLKAYAQENGYTYIDYNSAMRAEDGRMKAELSRDGVHPYKEAYSIMEEMVIPFLSPASITTK